MKKYLIAGAAVLVLDQVTKLFARIYFDNIQVIGNFFKLARTTNTGAGFSIFQGQNTLLAIIGIGIIGFLLYYFKKFKKSERIYVAVIIGAALGNVIDRIFLGHVVDWIAFSIWPTFNIADAAISVSAIILVYYSFKN